jgi:hypothetical protein
VSSPDNTEGRVSAVLTAFYGIMPWDQNRLTDAQIGNLMQELGYVRFLRDEYFLLYHFGKQLAVPEADLPKTLQEMIHGGGTDPLGALKRQAFEAFAFPRYGLPLSSETTPGSRPDLPALNISVEAALGILDDVEHHRLNDDVWANLYRGGTFRALCALAGEPLPW